MISLQTGWKTFPFAEVILTPPHFSSGLKGLRVIQLSDLHLTKNIDVSYLQALVEKVNELNPDLVVFTGDIIQTPATKLHSHLNVFKNIQAPSYYVTGNHDIVYGPKVLKHILEANGVICLDNDFVTLTLRGTPLQLVGLSDRYSFARGIKRPVKELFSRLDPQVSTILLAHQPKDIKRIGNTRIDIQLSGHTHGGQVYPFHIFVRLVQPYFEGLYTHKDTLLYVTRGLGYWGPRIRYKAPSEIPVFTIN